MIRTVLFCLLSLVVLPASAHARTLCTVIADAADGRILLEDGACSDRVTPASTFKIPISLMGFDAGILQDENTPALPFKKGYADWGGDAWRQSTDAARWMKYSVVWFSQQVVKTLGEAEFGTYVTGFDYGNADISGDPGKNNGLERSWIASSLAISPREQVAFLRKMLRGELPVGSHAVEMTMRIVEQADPVDGWTVQGKTGSAYPRKPDGSLDRTRGYGWYVGWMTRGDTTLVFARLAQDEKREQVSGGLRARAAFLKELPEHLGRLGAP
ncbi:MAG: class D beta-lactamase [Rhizobiaceae bacterium]|nr:class D beta-lactamase [Rhizobiaceae bacterium]